MEYLGLLFGEYLELLLGNIWDYYWGIYRTAAGNIQHHYCWGIQRTTAEEYIERLLLWNIKKCCREYIARLLLGNIQDYYWGTYRTTAGEYKELLQGIYSTTTAGEYIELLQGIQHDYCWGIYRTTAEEYIGLLLENKQNCCRENIARLLLGKCLLPLLLGKTNIVKIKTLTLVAFHHTQILEFDRECHRTLSIVKVRCAAPVIRLYYESNIYTSD